MLPIVFSRPNVTVLTNAMGCGIVLYDETPSVYAVRVQPIFVRCAYNTSFYARHVKNGHHAVNPNLVFNVARRMCLSSAKSMNKIEQNVCLRRFINVTSKRPHHWPETYSKIWHPGAFPSSLPQKTFFTYRTRRGLRFGDHPHQRPRYPIIVNQTNTVLSVNGRRAV